MDAVRLGNSEVSLERSASLGFAALLRGAEERGWTAPAAASVGAASVPIVVVLWAVLFPALRPAALAFVVAGFLFQRWRAAPATWSWAASVPLATILAWSLIPAPRGLPGAASCADLLSPPMLWRGAELGLVLVVVSVIVRSMGADRSHLPLARSDGWLVGLAATAGFAIAPAALLLGEQAARPFFGTVHLQIAVAGAILPALFFGIANASLEEVVYRGALLRWTEPYLGTIGAILVQAAAFGLAHTGSDFVASPLPVLATMFVMGIVAGVIVKRTGSLLVPVIVHAAFDIPLYYSLACRLS